jgi:ABC-type histidine transport system ATPase subunit
LSFSAVLVINEAEYFININNKINHRSISEDSLRSILKENILDFLFEMISNSYDIEKIQYRDLTDNIIKTGNDLFAKKKNNIDYADFFNCLFQVPLKIKINISLNGIPLESLSMGQRAIVLLKIILAYDDKPLLIDQPEEDLDNRYIYEHLVEAFKEAKNKRQIFIATHNANLAVNTDAEQIIVAKYDEGTISYELGTLENPMTKKDIKQILEGGDAAFRKREEKYGTFF